MTKIGKPRSAKGLATFCARIAGEKLASKIIILDLTSIETAPADYFVVCDCTVDVQVKALSDEIMRRCTKFSLQKPKIEGYDTGDWVLLDFFDVVLHIMRKEIRDFYKIEKLWGDAKFLQIDNLGAARSVKHDEILENYF